MRKFACLGALFAVAACAREAPDRTRVESADGIQVIRSEKATALDLARELTAKQRELFALLDNVDNDPAPLLRKPFRLIDRSDTSRPQLIGTWSNGYRDDYMRILSARLPAEELGTNAFELWRQEDGSVVVVSRLPEGRANMTVWDSTDGQWKARAIILHPSREELEWLTRHSVPLMAEGTG